MRSSPRLRDLPLAVLHQGAEAHLRDRHTTQRTTRSADHVESTSQSTKKVTRGQHSQIHQHPRPQNRACVRGSRHREHTSCAIGCSASRSSSRWTGAMRERGACAVPPARPTRWTSLQKSRGGNITKRDSSTSNMSSPHRTLTGCVVRLFVVYVCVCGLSSRSCVGRPLCVCAVLTTGMAA